MKAKRLFGVLMLVGLGFASFAAGQTRPLDVFKWERRVLVMFADHAADPWAFKQRGELLADRCGFADRDLLLLEVYGANPVIATGRWLNGEAVDEQPLQRILNAELRRYYNFDRGFGLVLVGKDGWEKRRSRLPDDVEQLFAQIDSMPMRRQEIAGDHCP